MEKEFKIADGLTIRITDQHGAQLMQTTADAVAPLPVNTFELLLLLLDNDVNELLIGKEKERREKLSTEMNRLDKLLEDY